MKSEIEARLESIADSLSTEALATANVSVQLLLRARITSLKDLLDIAQEESGDIELRSIACWLLGRISNKGATKSLLKAFDNSNAKLYWEAAKSLGILGSKRAVRRLINYLTKGEIVDKRVAAAHALGLIGDKRALDPLSYVLLDDNEPSVLRGEIAESLANLGDSDATLSLIQSLRDKSPEVKFWSAYALGEIGNKSALPELEWVKENDHSVLLGWGKISSEADDAIKNIKTRNSE